MMRARFKVHIQHGIAGDSLVAIRSQTIHFRMRPAEFGMPAFGEDPIALYKYRTHHRVRCNVACAIACQLQAALDPTVVLHGAKMP